MSGREPSSLLRWRKMSPPPAPYPIAGSVTGDTIGTNPPLARKPLMSNMPSCASLNDGFASSARTAVVQNKTSAASHFIRDPSHNRAGRGIALKANGPEASEGHYLPHGDCHGGPGARSHEDHAERPRRDLPHCCKPSHPASLPRVHLLGPDHRGLHLAADASHPEALR